jgi:hypothetical protein
MIVNESGIDENLVAVGNMSAKSSGMLHIFSQTSISGVLNEKRNVRFEHRSKGGMKNVAHEETWRSIASKIVTGGCRACRQRTASTHIATRICSWGQ